MGMSRLLKASIRHPNGGFPLLRDLVHERAGLYFDDTKVDTFLDKLSPLIAERDFDSLLDYYYLLKDDLDSHGEWRKVFDALTVQESFFWREMDQVHALVGEVVPTFFDANPGSTLSIWSAACAGGEEPLTIAMALQEEGWFDREKIDIYASDACTRAIDAAKKGIYRERSFRSLPDELREKYFLRIDGADGASRVSPGLHSRIRWGRTNLMSETDFDLAPVFSHVVFCRNVFIYFSENSAQKTVRSFARRMPAHGCLFLGVAESLMQIASDFELTEMGDAFVYVRNK